MAMCPTALYKRTSMVIRAASFHGEIVQRMARAAEDAVRSGKCDAGRKLLRATMGIIRRDIKIKRQGR